MTPEFATGIAALILGWTVVYSISAISVMVFVSPGDIMYGAKRIMITSAQGIAGILGFAKVMLTVTLMMIVFYWASMEDALKATLIYGACVTVIFLWRRGSKING